VKSLFYCSFFFVLGIGASFLAGSWVSRPEIASTLHPPALTAADADEEDSGQFPVGTVRISPERQQLIGVRTGTVDSADASQELRVLGRVAVDVTRVYRLIAAVDGWIQDVPPIAPGSLVAKNEVLATFYSPEFLSAQQAYIFALGSMVRFKANPREPPEQINLTKLNLAQYQDTLRNLGMGELQIKELAKTRLYTENIRITAPSAGFILSRNISPGQRFDKGYEWYRLADLSRIWILTDTYEKETKHLPPGKIVKVSHRGTGKTLQARVSETLPQFDAASRTLNVRLETENPDYLLKPDMFVDVEIPVTLAAAITVPADAILHSGRNKTVFVDRGRGFFEPREVETGVHLGGRVEVVKGLEPGERIVLSGNFLIDSESKLSMAAAGMQPLLEKDPVCGQEVSPRKAEKQRRKVMYRGQSYFFCSDEHKQQFETMPDQYVKQ
jgi:membrane fusion protein, copper/silver efflux system